MSASVATRPASVPWVPVRRHLTLLRRSRGSRSMGQVLSSGYEWLLYVAIGGGLVVTGVQRASGTVAGAPPELAPWLGLVAGLAAAGALSRGLRALGPVVVGPVVAGWLLPSPVDRAQLLTRRFLALFAVLGVVGAGFGALVARGQAAAGWWQIGVACGLITALLVAIGTAVQPHRRRAAAVDVAGRVLVVGALLGVVGLVLAARLDLPAPAWPSLHPLAVAGVLGALAVVSAATAVSALRGLGGLDARRLTAGTPILAALSVGTSTIDGSIVTAVLQERRLLRRATVRSRRHRPGRVLALLTAHARTALRSPATWGWAAGVMVVPYLMGLIAPPAAVPVAQLAGATLVAAGFAGPLRTVAGSGALRRALGGADRALIAVHAVVPLVVTVLWTLAVLPAGGGPWSALIVPAGAIAVVLRHATRPERPDTITLLDTPFGTVPVEAVRDLSRGPVLFALIAAVLIAITPG